MTNRLLSLLLLLLAAVACTTANAQQRSAKRGLGWDEKSLTMSTTLLDLMSEGVAWVYNWGVSPKDDAFTSGTRPVEFYPMCWNASFNENTLRQYLTKHPETKYLLGFNEPNFSSQSNMTPSSAAKSWERLEKLAAEFSAMPGHTKLKLVAPALNFSGEKVGGRTWTPYEWLDEFFKQRPDAQVDCLALHCYMNWCGAMTWFAVDYFYKDVYTAENAKKYPNLVAFLDKYKKANGHFPRMMLTEFCAWEYDGAITGVDFQIDQMTQKVQQLEKSDLVEGYAWFMANGTATSFPYWSILQNNRADSPLSTLGQVYVHMSSFDSEKWYTLGERIVAKDYIDASADNQAVRLRPNTDSGNAAPLQVELKGLAWAEYQVELPQVEGGNVECDVTLRLNTKFNHNVYFYIDGTRINTPVSVPSTSSQWQDCTFRLAIPSGRHTLRFFNNTGSTLLLDELMLRADLQGLESVCTDAVSSAASYDLSGRRVSAASASGRSLRIDARTGRKCIR